jgi:hypothetical protein
VSLRQHYQLETCLFPGRLQQRIGRRTRTNPIQSRRVKLKAMAHKIDRNPHNYSQGLGGQWWIEALK